MTNVRELEDFVINECMYAVGIIPFQRVFNAFLLSTQSLLPLFYFLSCLFVQCLILRLFVMVDDLSISRT
ncbi:hypothetical protein VIGAN_09170200 [Vigna angularis var. angularis]|uniref:Uncharacterized protein n=1 Tax=Vigna angularis var. angularis TaxID=157739 RepID=A0A0S3SYV6_PHAAN|nr:hypothetical protein VIGAN_09170200 [Vigna angularis var. angularis]